MQMKLFRLKLVSLPLFLYKHRQLKLSKYFLSTNTQPALIRVMFKQTCTHLTRLPKNQVLEWLSRIETVICDAGGVLWHFDRIIDGAADTISKLRSTGRRTFVVTNNSGVSSDYLIKKARNLGIDVDEGHMLTSAHSIAKFLKTKNFQKKVYVVGEWGIRTELAKVDICSFSINNEKQDKPMALFAKEMELDPGVGAVVVGKDDSFSVPTIIRACSYLQNRNVLFLGTCLDAAYPIDNQRTVIGAAAMIAAIKTISGRKPLILGKPNPWMVQEPLNCKSFDPEKTLMIGDTLQTDMMFARNNGFQSIFVGSGVNTLKDVDRIRNSGNKKLMQMVPDAYLPSLGHLLEFLC